MAGQKFQYDESGSTFLYFLISFLGLVLVPSTFYIWPSDKSEVKELDEGKKNCRCPGCRLKILRLKKPERWKGLKKSFQRFLLAIGWCFLAYLVYKVQQFDYEYANFDPYDILNVGMQASQAEIKRAYRKLSLIYHPDKTTGDEKKFLKLNKAYQALTDDLSRKNYELYGNPDGPGAMNFGIALPSWIVEKENSILVLGVYTLIFMIVLPTAVAMWWYKSTKFCSDQVLASTTQIFIYFYHKTSHMLFKRVLMILSTAMEYEKESNAEITERSSDGVEIPSLLKAIPHFNPDKIKERPCCYPYAIKAQALFHAHLSRIPLNENTLDADRLVIIKMAPTLVNEMVSCVSQIIIMALAGKLSRLPSLETVEVTMKLSPCIVQAIADGKSSLLQLPYVREDILRYFVSKKRPIKTIHQFVALPIEERRSILRHLTDDEFDNVLKVCSSFPHISVDVEMEVMGDDDSGVFTAGDLVTVTVLLKRSPLEAFMEKSGEIYHQEAYEEDKEKDGFTNKSAKESGWKQRQGKKGKATKKKPIPPTKVKKEEKEKQTNKEVDKTITKSKEKPPVKEVNKAASKDVKNKGLSSNKEKKIDTKKAKLANQDEENDSESESDDTISHSDESAAEEADTESHRDDKMDVDDDLEWEKFQRGISKRGKVLEGQSKISHSVHAPYFTNDKQEYWWIYICDRKKKMLVTIPFQVTNLVSEEEVQLKLTAPRKPGHYTFQLCVRSDSYIGFDITKDIKLDILEAREISLDHPQWEDFSSDEDHAHSDVDDDSGGNESDFASDSDVPFYDSD